MLQIKITNRSFEKYFYALLFDAKLIDRLQLSTYLPYTYLGTIVAEYSNIKSL